MLKKIFTSLILCSASALLYAADSKTELPPRAVESPLSFASVSQMLISLVVVLAIILAAAWLLKRSGRLPGMNNGRIKVLEVASLGAREKAVLLHVDDKKLLVGVSQGHVETLHVFEGKEASFQNQLDAVKDNRQSIKEKNSD